MSKRKSSKDSSVTEKKTKTQDQEPNYTEMFVSSVLKKFEKAANPTKAKAMAKYLKSDQFFYGIQTPDRRKIIQDALKKHPEVAEKLQSDVKLLEEVVLKFWRGKSRDEMYVAMSLCETYRTKHMKKNETEYLALVEKIIRTCHWWDLTDAISSTFSRAILDSKSRNTYEDLMRTWSKDSSFWVRRASILGHLNHKNETNTELLEETIVLLMHEKEFFIRKAIGWVLRQYARTEPDWVRQFVKKHEDSLSPLSKREALKHISKAESESEDADEESQDSDD